MIEYAKYYDECRQKWVSVAILQFDGDYAVVRTESGRYQKILIKELQSC